MTISSHLRNRVLRAVFGLAGLAVAFAGAAALPAAAADAAEPQRRQDRPGSKVFDENAKGTDPSELPRRKPADPPPPQPQPHQDPFAPQPGDPGQDGPDPGGPPDDAQPPQPPQPPPAPQPAVKRKGVPAAEAVESATGKMKKRFAGDFEGRTPLQKLSLGRKLLAAAAESSGSAAEQYVLLRESAAASAAGGDVAGALKAVDRLAELFRVERRAAATEILGAAVKTAPKTPMASAAFAEAGLQLAGEHMAADDYAAAVKSVMIAEAAARSAKDAALAARVKERAKEVREADAQYRKLQSALEALKTDGDDAAANLKVGRFYCFVRGDWSRGLPMLAKGGDAALRSLAEQDLAQPAEVLARVELGNAWWDRAKAEGGPTADRCKQRAAKWYAEAEPEVDEATRAMIQERMESVRLGRVVDLIKLADGKGTVSGSWKKQKGDLVCAANGSSRIQFPYTPPEEYDFRIEFTVLGGQTIINQYFPGRSGGQMQWSLYTRSMYLSGAGGSRFGGGASARLPETVWFKRRHTMLVKVRRDRVSGYMNGKQWVTVDLNAAAAAQDDFGAGVRGGVATNPKVLGLGSDYTQVIFHRVEVVELSGEGTVGR